MTLPFESEHTHNVIERVTINIVEKFDRIIFY
jgi:hypothetical protein